MKPKQTKIVDIYSIQIGLASPKNIKKWAERILPNGKKIGEVTSSQTVNYKTLKPEKGGLFCERIFGPVTDFECACGRKKMRPKQQYCPDCDVEYTTSKVRRYRLGYIQLVTPVTHVWYLKGRPSYIPILLDMPKKKVEAISYCTETVYMPNSPLPYKFEWKYGLDDFYRQRKSIPYFSLATSSWELKEDWTYFLYYMTSPVEKTDIPIYRLLYDNSKNFQVSDEFLGAEGIQKLLKKIDLDFLDRHLRSQLFYVNDDIYDLENEIKNLDNQRSFFEEKQQEEMEKFLYQQYKILIYSRARKVRQLKIVRQLRRNRSRPEWMILSVLPVLPPELRPIIQLDGDQIAISDLNKLYQKVLFRNNRIKKNSSLKSDEMKYGQRLLQEAVDALLENGKGGADPICASNDRPLKSLSDILKGKKGRFRQNLLGKRVDYSGRSVIVVGPKLKLHECGLPKEVALELFQPFVIRSLMEKKIVRTIVGAKRVLQQKDSRVWKILEQVMENHPVLLNRAPTLHRVGFQAFQPKLVEGRAILLHPLVCTAFNADFDGDQMAVHVPLCFEAQAEAWVLMWSRNNLLSPATGQPMILPSQDMVLGCYYLTTTSTQIKSQKQNTYSTVNEVLKVFDRNSSPIHYIIWIRWNSMFETNAVKEKPFELQIQTKGAVLEIYSSYRRQFDFIGKQQNQFIRTTIGRVLMNKNIEDTLKQRVST